MLYSAKNPFALFFGGLNWGLPGFAFIKMTHSRISPLGNGFWSNRLLPYEAGVLEWVFQSFLAQCGVQTLGPTA